MKKFATYILLLCMVLSLAVCGQAETTAQEVELSMQGIYDANQIEVLFENHQNVLIQDAIEGEVYSEKFLTKEFSFEYYPDEEFEAAQFMTDDASYAYSSGDYLRYLYIAPDGVTNDFASDRAAKYVSVVYVDSLSEVIESVSEKDGCITVNSVLDQETLAEMAEEDLLSGKSEYVLDAETLEVISVVHDYAFGDGSVFNPSTKVVYDAEEPEMIKTFMEYANQTEDLRNITVVSNPGTEKEISQDFQAPKGLIIGFSWNDAFEDKVEFYADAACTESYDPYAGTDSDLTVYVKWNV